MILEHQNGAREMLLVCLAVYATRLFTFDSPCFGVFHRLRDWFVRGLNGWVCHLYPCSQLLSVFHAVFVFRAALLHVTCIATPGVSNVPFIRCSEVFCRHRPVTILLAA
jgi:hypothetical protein